MEPVKAASSRREIAMFLVVVFATSWLLWFVGIRTQVREDLLLFGAAGPALAAALLIGTRQRGARVPSRRFMLIFLGLIPVCWTALVINNAGRVGFQSLDWSAILILPALLPAAFVAFFLNAGKIRWQGSRWPLIAGFSVPAILLIPAVFAHFAGFPIVYPRKQDNALMQLGVAMGFFAKQLLFAGLLEEPGWRGWLLPRMQQRHSPLTASLLVWFPWALWHAPLDFTGGVGRTLVNYIQVRVVFFVAISILLTWLFNHSNGSILVVALFHAGINTFPFVLPYSPPVLALILVWAVWVLIADRMWRSPSFRLSAQPGSSGAPSTVSV